jgi:outer membrane autotransporter protein
LGDRWFCRFQPYQHGSQIAAPATTVDSLNVGVYGSTYDVESGVFVNVMAKVNQFDNKAKVTMSDGTRARAITRLWAPAVRWRSASIFA